MRLIGATTDEKLVIPLSGGVRAVRPWGGLWGRSETYLGASRRLSLRATSPTGFLTESFLPPSVATSDENVGADHASADARAAIGCLNRGPEIAAEDSGSHSPAQSSKQCMPRERAKFRSFAWVFFSVLAAMPQALWLQAQGPARIRLATLAPKGSSYYQILQAMGEKWRQAPGGGASLTIFADGSMGGEADMVRRMRVGQLQAGMLTVVGLSEIDPSVSALQNMPMTFRSLDEVDYIRQKLAPSIEKKLLEKGFVVLCWGDSGWVRFFSKEPVIYPADLKRMKLFTWAGDAKQLDIMKAGGYQPISLETNDILPSLQTGLINAVPSTPFYALAGQFYGPAPHMLELNWAPLVGGAVVTRKTWDSLSGEARDAMMKAATEAGEQIKAKSRAESNQAVETMRKRGLTVHAVTPEIEVAWRKAAEEVYPKIRGAIVPAEMFDEVIHLLQEFRKSATSKR